MVTGLEQLIGAQSPESETAQSIDEIRRDAVVAQFLQIVEREIGVSGFRKSTDEIACDTVIAERHESTSIADPIAGGLHRADVFEIGAMHSHHHELINRRPVVSIRTELVDHCVSNVMERQPEL